MLWLQYAYAKYNNYQRTLEFRESSFARWGDERGVSADTKPLPLFEIMRKYYIVKYPLGAILSP